MFMKKKSLNIFTLIKKVKNKIKLYVFDYDGDDAKELERYEKEMTELISKHKLKEIY